MSLLLRARLTLPTLSELGSDVAFGLLPLILGPASGISALIRQLSFFLVHAFRAHTQKKLLLNQNGSQPEHQDCC